MDSGQAPRACTRVWLGVDSGVPVRKQTRHHVARVAREGTLMWIRAKLPVHALVSGLESIWALPSENKHGSNFVQSYFVRILAYGTWLRCNINAPCLAWSRFRRSRQKANTASCVNTAMIEGMRYEVCLLLQWLVGAPSYRYRQSSPCMHSCLNWSRFRRSRQEAHTVSYGILRKVEPDL